MKNLFLKLFILLILPFSVIAEEVNQIELASILLRDGYYEKAQTELKTANPKSFDEKFKFSNISGLIYMGLNKHKLAINNFNKSLKLLEGAKGLEKEDKTKKEKQLYLYLSQSHYKSGDFQQTINYMKRSKYRNSDRVSAFLLVSSAYWRLGQQDKALNELFLGQKKFPGNFEFHRQQVMYYIDLNLYQAAYTKGLALLKEEFVYPRDLSAIGAAFKSKGQLDYSVKYLNASLLRFPLDNEILVELAHSYLKLNKTLLAAESFEKASWSNSKYYSEAVELYRNSGRLSKAFWLSQYITDPKLRLKQVLAIQLEKENYGSVKSLETELSRKNLLKDQEISYALAYTFFRLGEFNSAKRYLNNISNPSLVKKAVALREGMSECSTAGVWTCM